MKICMTIKLTLSWILHLYWRFLSTHAVHKVNIKKIPKHLSHPEACIFIVTHKSFEYQKATIHDISLLLKATLQRARPATRILSIISVLVEYGDSVFWQRYELLGMGESEKWHIKLFYVSAISALLGYSARNTH